MPILIKTYDWRQTEELIILRIQLKGVTCLKDVDIFTSDNYLKVSYNKSIHQYSIKKLIYYSYCHIPR